MLANSLRAPRFETTLITSTRDHLFQPALLYIAFNGARPRAVRDERALLRDDVKMVQDTVTEIDLANRVVVTARGEKYESDHLVLATGVQTDPSQIPGLDELNSRFGDYHSSIDQARKLWNQLDAFSGGTIALGQSTPICKCPPSPIEGILLADALLRKRGLRAKTRLIFFTPYPRAYPAEPMNQIVEPILLERGVEIRTFFDVDRVDPSSWTLTSIEGEEIACDLPIVVPPFIGSPITYYPPEALDPSRLVVTDKESLQVRGFEQVYAIGDANNLPTSKSGVGAHLEAKAVADTLAGRSRLFGGRTHCPFDFGDGRGTFVTGSYHAPVVKSPPTRFKHFLKMMFAHIYWVSLRGWLEPAFNVYFKLTEPKSPGPS
jgi:sulfide:quinone oxidoreductase